jgi:hypothetical protein
MKPLGMKQLQMLSGFHHRGMLKWDEPFFKDDIMKTQEVMATLYHRKLIERMPDVGEDTGVYRLSQAGHDLVNWLCSLDFRSGE